MRVRLFASGLFSALLPAALLLGGCDCQGSLESDDGGPRADSGPRADGALLDGARGDGSTAPRDGGGGACADLVAVIRDFRADHPDFEAALGSQTGIVQDMLGPDNKPVYAPSGPTSVTAGAAEFDQWYRDIDGVNLHFEIPLPLTETSPGVFVFDDSDFFPIDGMGWGEEVMGHNFHFTTEVHATFVYRGGEVFTFRGDDDVFLFINRRLALDLGGVHGAEMGTVDFDAMAAALGIAVGGTYQFDLFHAERHTSESNFRMETSIDCFQLI